MTASQQAVSGPKKKKKPLRKLAELHKALTQKSLLADLEGLQAYILQEIAGFLSCQAYALILVDEANENWIIRRALYSKPGSSTPVDQASPTNDRNLEWSYDASLRSAQGLTQECMHSQQTLHSPDVAADPRFNPASDGVDGIEIQSMLCVPLLVNARSLGVIQVVNKLHASSIVEFQPEDQELLEMIAALAAGAFHTLRADQRLKISQADLEASRWELVSEQNALNALFENLPDAVYRVDSQYQIIAINGRRKQRIPAHIGGKENRQNPDDRLCYRALFSRNAPCPECLVKETFKTGQAALRIERRFGNMLSQPNEVTHLRKGKERREAEPAWTDDASEWEIHTYPVPDRDQKTFQVIVLERDITEKRQLENILTQSEKLAAMGQLAAGIAHEINNPLTAIIANAQILHRSLPKNDDLQESVDLIARAGARAVQVVRNLLDFSRKEEYHLGVTNLNENLNRALELVQHELLARGVELDFDPGADLPPILASQDHLQSVWLNLLLNAIDSLEKIPGDPHPPHIQVTTRKVNKDIVVTVADNGKGIPIERLSRIFEPFFTTKAPGRGTGLGLSVSHRIIKQHGGVIQVESQVGVGSVFTVTLPIN